MPFHFERPSWLPKNEVSDDELHRLIERFGKISGPTFAGKGAGTGLTKPLWPIWAKVVEAAEKHTYKGAQKVAKEKKKMLELAELVTKFADKYHDAFALFCKHLDTAPAEDVERRRADAEKAAESKKEAKEQGSQKIERLEQELDHMTLTTTRKFVSTHSRVWFRKMFKVYWIDEDESPGENSDQDQDEDDQASDTHEHEDPPKSARQSAGPEYDFFVTMWPLSLLFSKAKFSEVLPDKEIPSWFPGVPRHL